MCFTAEGFDLVAYTMKKTSDSISDTSSPIKENHPTAYSLLLKNRPHYKIHDQNCNMSGMSIRRLAEIDQLVCNGETIDIANNLIDDKNGSEFQNLYSDSDGTDDDTAEDQFDLRSDEHSLIFGSNKCSTTDVIDQNGVASLDSGYGEKENTDDVDDFRGIRNWYGSIPKPLNTNRFGMGKTRGGSALRRNILTARSNPTHQAYNYAINNHSIKFNSSNHETTIRLDQNGSSTNTFQLLRTNGSVIRANQIIASNSASGNGVGVASVLNRTGGRRIGQIVQTQKLNRRLMTLGTSFDNVVANVTAGNQFIRPLNPKVNQIDDKLKMIKRGMQKTAAVPGNIRLSNILPVGTIVNGFSLDDMLGARPRNERNISNNPGNYSSGHELNGINKKIKSSNFGKDSSHNCMNLKTNHTSSSSIAGQSVLKNSVYGSSSYNAKNSLNRSNHRNTSSTATNVTTTTVTIAMTSTSSLTSNGTSNTFTSIPSTPQGNVIMVNGTGTSLINNANRGRSLIKPSLYSRSVSGGNGKGSSGNANPRK